MQFNLHPQEKNKLPDQVAINEGQWSRKKMAMKNHHRAAIRGTETQKIHNPLIEKMFHILVNQTKEFVKVQPEKHNRVCIEINFKPHPVNTETLHSIQTAQVYLSLKCTMKNDYNIDYCFCNCPFELELTKLIKKLTLTDCMEIFRPTSSYTNFHNRSLQVQPERFIKLL